MLPQPIIIAALAALTSGHITRRFTSSDTQQGILDPGVIADCTYWVGVESGDTCEAIEDYFGLRQDQFLAYNPALKNDCSGLTVGHTYCVEQNFGNGPSTTTASSGKVTTTSTSQIATFQSTTSATTTLSTTTLPQISTTVSKAPASTSSIPQPVQIGIISTCQTFYLVQAGDYCQKIVDQYGTFTLSDFSSWNPAVGSSCSNLQTGYYVCVGLPSTPTTKANPTPRPSSTNAFPSPVQSGIISTCKRFYQVVSGDYCQKIVDQYGTFTLAQFYSWNPAVGSSCASLQLGYYVCVGLDGTPTITSSAIPSPTQSGIIKTCIKYDKAGVGGSCNAFSNRLSISLPRLYAWNSVLGHHGENCAQNFIPGDYYCIAVSGPLPAPGPTQAGVVDTCTGYVMANPGGSCPVFANRVGISLQQLYAWNPVLGTNGENCQTKFWASTYYCTSVAG